MILYHLWLFPSTRQSAALSSLQTFLFVLYLILRQGDIPWQAELCARGSMDRASDSGSGGWGFESLRARHVVADGIPFATTLSFSKQTSFFTHSGAPPSQTGPAAPGFDLVINADLKAGALRTVHALRSTTKRSWWTF